jgi:hypothetical protein
MAEFAVEFIRIVVDSQVFSLAAFPDTNFVYHSAFAIIRSVFVIRGNGVRSFFVISLNFR